MTFVFSGCGGGGGGSSQDAVIGGEHALLYSLYAEDSFGERIDDNEVLSEDEIDCSHPLFTRTEPLPAGTHPDALVSPEDTYWDCPDSRERNFADGSISATAKRDYQDIYNFWNVCRVGTEPPDFSGNWVATENGRLCFRSDILPGIVICIDDYSVNELSDGAKTWTTGDSAAVYYEGKILDFLESEGETCHLRPQPNS